MEWLAAVAIVSIVSGVTIAVVVLLAVRSLRGSLNDGAVRQSQQIKRLIETVTVLGQQQQSAHQKLQVLAETDRQLGEELTALYERISEDGAKRPTQPRRLN